MADIYVPSGRDPVVALRSFILVVWLIASFPEADAF